MDLTIVIVNYNTATLFDRLFDTIEKAAVGLTFEVIVVDNASRDDSLARLRDFFPQVHVIANETNVGFGRANNQALEYARGKYILLLNTDAFMESNTLTESIRYMDGHQDVGVLGTKLVSEEQDLQPSCRYFPTPWNLFLASTGLSKYFPRTTLIDDLSWNHNSSRDCDWVVGCFLMTRRSIVDKIGLFDPRFFLYYEEVDFCKRVKLEGHRIVYFAGGKVIHIGGTSAASAGTLHPVSKQLLDIQSESELLYLRKHFGIAGVLSALFLNGCVATGLKFVNGALRRDLQRIRAARDYSASLWRKCLETRFGGRPTR